MSSSLAVDSFWIVRRRIMKGDSVTGISGQTVLSRQWLIARPTRETRSPAWQPSVIRPRALWEWEVVGVVRSVEVGSGGCGEVWEWEVVGVVRSVGVGSGGCGEVWEWEVVGVVRSMGVGSGGCGEKCGSGK